MHGIADPRRDRLPLREIGHFVQAVEQEQQVPAVQEAFTKPFRHVEMGAVQLIVDERLQPMVKVAQFPQRQEYRQHVRGQTDGLGSLAQTPEEQAFEVSGLARAGVPEDDDPFSIPRFRFAKGFGQRNLERAPAAIPQDFFSVGRISEAVLAHAPQIHHGAQRECRCLRCRWGP